MPKKRIPVKKHHVPIVGMIALVLILGAILLAYKNPRPKQELPDLSRINFNGMEPPVAAKIQRLREEIQNHPDSADAWGKLAMNLDAADLPREAVAAYQQAAALNSADFRWPYFCAIALSQSDPRQSIDWFGLAYKIRPDYVPLIINYGDALFAEGKAEQAAEKYQQALRHDPKAAHADFGLAQIAFSKGNLQTARQYLQQAFDSDPAYAEAYNLLATICRQMNETNCVEQATAAAKDLPKKTRMVDPVYAQVGAEGESSLWHRSRGSEYMKQNNYDAAIIEFQKAMQIRPDVQTREDLAHAFSSAGKFQEALQEYEQVVREHPTAQNYFGLGLTCAKMGSLDRAEQFFKNAIERDQNFAEAYFNLAVVYAKTGRLPQTVEALKQAVRVKPDYTDAHYHLALVYLQENDEKAALNEYESVNKLNPAAGRQLQALIQQGKRE